MSLKVLGQVAPSATTATTLYTVPSGKSAASSTMVVCNRAATAGSYRVAVRPAGASLSNEHYIAYGIEVPGNGSDAWTIGMTLAAGDVVTVYATTADFSFNLFGDES